jgi:ketosteroid isomerase-like protein
VYQAQVSVSCQALKENIPHADDVLPTGDPYPQNYVFYVRLENGKIREYRKYMNPVQLGKALALLQG